MGALHLMKAERERRSGDDETSGSGVKVPYEYAWFQFREAMGWLDDVVMDRQTDIWVDQAWMTYQLQLEFGAR